jgi:hypothetical protein
MMMKACIRGVSLIGGSQDRANQAIMFCLPPSLSTTLYHPVVQFQRRIVFGFGALNIFCNWYRRERPCTVIDKYKMTPGKIAATILVAW